MHCDPFSGLLIADTSRASFGIFSEVNVKCKENW